MCNEAYNALHWTSLQPILICSPAVGKGRLFRVHIVNNYFLICISQINIMTDSGTKSLFVWRLRSSFSHWSCQAVFLHCFDSYMWDVKRGQRLPSGAVFFPLLYNFNRMNCRFNKKLNCVTELTISKAGTVSIGCDGESCVEKVNNSVRKHI